MDNRTLEEVRKNETKLIEEIKSLEKQLEYLRSGEYYNQLRFERNMLEDVVSNGEVSKEDREFIDMTHRNTELLEQNQKLKKLLEEKNKHQIFIDTQDMEERYAEGLYQDYLEEENKKYKTQQKEFIKYLENGIDICDGFLDTVKSDLQEIPYGVISAGKTYIITRIKENETTHKVYEEILKKYKEIIGVLDEKK